MSDPFGERLRSYYQSIQGDAPAGLEARVTRGFEAAPRPGRTLLVGGPHSGWLRPGSRCWLWRSWSATSGWARWRRNRP
jgi:hypothetical protein